MSIGGEQPQVSSQDIVVFGGVGKSGDSGFRPTGKGLRGLAESGPGGAVEEPDSAGMGG
jgi:hypothetical protein